MFIHFLFYLARFPKCQTNMNFPQYTLLKIKNIINIIYTKILTGAIKTVGAKFVISSDHQFLEAL